ncbi:PREDICTED: DNA-binding protein RHL1 isoform X2 [Lupinus angustifolius]|uniref:DNA-binding protein RHL1 isoform X2 n=1 Tax=Lupinus angustifolius TaxID=3871 RepID=UPI00092E30AB|nr:PREDICTED: DNA-binding protein RHL1 isoform X2 [Lupinus angustifolius]
MVRATKTKKKENDESVTNPEALERKRLKSLAFSNNILSQTPSTTTVHLNPSTTVVKHHGADIIKKSHRKTKFLFSFSGLFAPISGGKIGELKDLGTKNPILYLHFPQGQMKLFGTIVYPQNRYLTLQFSRGGKSVMCEDYFDNMIVFSDAWWIGRKDENPEEARLEFPKELYEGQQAEYDFKGGAGAASVVSQGVPKTRVQCKELESPETPIEDDLSDSEISPIDTKEGIAVRRSVRTPKKSYKFAEISSDDDSGESSPELSEHEEKVVKKKDPCSVVVDIGNENTAEEDKIPRENKECASVLKSKKVSKVASVTASNGVLSSNRGPLVQATISTLFKKVEEKKAPTSSLKSQSSKVSGQKLQPAGSKRKIDLDEGPKKRPRKSKDKDPGENIMEKSKEREVEDDDDDIDEFSNASEGTNDSDEDWTV